MGNRGIIRACALVTAAFFAALSCSTTRVLGDGEYRLEKNKVEVLNGSGFNTREIQPYIKQHANPSFIFGWNPLLNVYNWSSKDGNGLFSKIFRGIGVAPVVYRPELVESSVENICNHLQYLGYYGSKVESEVRVNRRKVSVDYKVTLGRTYTIYDIDFIVPGGDPFAADFFADTANLSVRRGDRLSEASLEAETERSAAVMRNKGYYGFNKNYYFFEADTLAWPGLAALEMKVMDYTRNEQPSNAVPHRKYHFGNVTISHDKDLKFSEKLLKDLNLIRPGDVYNDNVVSTTYSRFSSLSVFNSVNIEMTQADTNVVDCAISLSQSRIQGFKVNLEASSNSSGLMGVSPRLSYYHKNIFHGGEWLNLSFMGNFQFKLNDKISSNELGVSAGLSIPRFIGIPNRLIQGPNIPRTEINASYNYQDRPEYSRNIISTSYGYTGTFRRRTIYQLYPLQMKLVRLNHMSEEFYQKIENNPFLRNAYQNHLDVGMGLTAFYSTASTPNPKESYHYTRLLVDVSGNFLSCFNSLMKTDAFGSRTIWDMPYSQYIRTELTFGKTWAFGKENTHAVATRVLAGIGYAYGNSTAIPFEKQFYCGGASSLRGWQARAVGPGSQPKNEYFIIPSQTGDLKFEANVEYRFPMFWKLSGAVFVDAGNIWTIRDAGEGSQFKASDFTRQIAANTGLGLRVDLNFLLLRVDMGVKVHDPSRVGNEWVIPADWLSRDGFAIHFGVGYPF